jgi:hypothetical protein
MLKPLAERSTSMIASQSSVRGTMATTLRVLIVFDTVALLFAGIVHLVGANIPLGAATFDEPALLPAGIVETLAGLLFAWAAYTVFAARPSAWTATFVAHLFAIAGFLVGIYATRLGTTPFNHDYHYVMLVVFVVGLVLVLLPTGRAALGRGSSTL